MKWYGVADFPNFVAANPDVKLTEIFPFFPSVSLAQTSVSVCLLTLARIAVCRSARARTTHIDRSMSALPHYRGILCCDLHTVLLCLWRSSGSMPKAMAAIPVQRIENDLKALKEAVESSQVEDSRARCLCAVIHAKRVRLMVPRPSPGPRHFCRASRCFLGS